MSKPNPLPPTLQAYVDYMARAGVPCRAHKVITAYHCSNGKLVNHFRQLIARGLVRDVTKTYQAGEPYTGPRFPEYVLTDLGKAHAFGGRPETRRIHVIPIGDYEIHAAQATCWCHPVERESVWIHNAKDCREARERAGIKSSEGWVNIAEVLKD